MHQSRESIFTSVLRTFCKMFAGVIGLLLAIIVIGLLITFCAAPMEEPARSRATIAPDADGNRDELSLSTPVILRINFHGVIGAEGLTADNIETILLDSRDGIFAHDRVKGILLCMNTPGGAASDSDTIYRLLAAYKAKYNIPIYAYTDGMCASGGVYISSAADRSYASPATLYGSIGVLLGPTFNFSEGMSKVGISSTTLTEGKDKDMLNPFRPWRPNEDECLRNVTKALYDRFVDIAVSARPLLDKEKLVNEYGAQVYIAQVAQEYGYINDGSSSYSSALSDLVKAAGIQEKEPYQVVQLDIPPALLSGLTHATQTLLKGKIVHSFDLGPFYRPEWSGKPLYLYLPMH